MYCEIIHAWVKLYGHATCAVVLAGLAFVRWQTRWQVEANAHICTDGGGNDKLSNFSKSFAKLLNGWFF